MYTQLRWQPESVKLQECVQALAQLLPMLSQITDGFPLLLRIQLHGEQELTPMHKMYLQSHGKERRQLKLTSHYADTTNASILCTRHAPYTRHTK